MNNKNRAANPGLLVMALLLVLLALVVVLIAVVLATDSKKQGNDAPITTSAQNVQNTTTPITTVPNGPENTTTADPSSTTTDTPNTGTGTTTANGPQITTPNTDTTQPPNTGKNTVPVNSSDINKGALLLVDNAHLVSFRPKFPARSELVGNTALQKELGLVRVKGTGNYKMPHSNHFMNEDAVEYFYDMMEAFVKENGSRDIFLRNVYYCDYTEAVPHANIHATGYAIDLQIMNDNGQYSLKSNSGFYNWFIENCAEYGFIFAGDTQNSSSASGYSTFRFVGTAHAGCMKVYSMDLQQYLTYITNRTPDSCIRYTDTYGVDWWVYYVKASASETTDVTVFGDETCYKISGDNQTGFVVTVNASKLG